MSEHYSIIGETAGQIYRTLEKSGKKSALQIQKEAGIADNSVFQQALGWLAREGKVEFEKSGKSWVLSLASSPVC